MCLLRNYNILKRMSIQYKNNDIFIFSSVIMEYSIICTYTISLLLKERKEYSNVIGMAACAGASTY